MPRVGDPAVFAIEWETTLRDPPEAYGRFCFWIAGSRVGDYTQEVRLSATTDWLREFLAHADERHLDSLDGKAKEEVFAYVHDTAVITTHPNESLEDAAKRYDRSVPERLRHDWTLQSRLRTVFHLDDVGGDAFYNTENIILLNDHTLRAQRMIWRDLRTMRLSEAFLPDHVFDTVAEEFLAECGIPVTLAFLFQMSHDEPINLNGALARRRYQRQVRGWERIRIRLFPHNGPIHQGVRITSGKVEMEHNGRRQRDVIVWAENYSPEYEFRIIGQQGAMLKIWNVWRSDTESQIREGVGNAGMLIEEQSNAVKLSCSDGVGAPDFQDLIIEIAFLGSHPE